MPNQDPRNSPPALPPQPWQVANQSGVKHGLQASETWDVGQKDERQLCDQLLAASLWRLSIFGSRHIEFDIQYGTSKARNIRHILPPVLLFVPGQLVVTARPLATDTGQYIGAYALVTCTPCSSSRESEARYVMNGPGPLPDEAARFRALSASVVTIADNAVPLAAGGWIPLIAGSVLTSGTGYVEFDT